MEIIAGTAEHHQRAGEIADALRETILKVTTPGEESLITFALIFVAGEMIAQAPAQFRGELIEHYQIGLMQIGMGGA